MTSAAEPTIEKANGKVHPALSSFLYEVPARASTAKVAARKYTSGAISEGTGHAVATDGTARQAGLQVLFVCPSSPFTALVADALRSIDPRCQIRRATVAAIESTSARDAASMILIDMDNLLGEGEALIRSLSSQQVSTAIVAVSSSMSESAIDHALNAGALAYLPKSYTRPLVECVLRLVLHGEGYRPSRSSRQAPTASPLSAEIDADFAAGLTARETDVLGEIAQGCSNFEIARRLRMSEATVKTHAHKIFRKLNVHNRAEAALRAARMREIQKLQIDEAERGKLNLSWLQREMTHRHMLRDQWVFRSGDVGSELFYLQRGRVYLPEIDVTLGPGDVFGEVGLFTAERKRTCSARCATDVDVLSLSREKARRIYFANPQFALFILTLVATRLMAERIRAGTPLG